MHFRVLLALALIAALLAPAAAQVSALEQAVADAEARGVRTGVAVCDSAGRVLFRHRAAEAFAPASNMKLLTAAGVLHGLGAEFEFRTVFQVRDGELVVVASGDPNWLHDTEHDPERVFGNVARELRARNVSAVRSIRLVAGPFTGPTRPPTWPQDQLHTYYCAPTGGFVLEQGTFKLAIAPSGTEHARVDLLAPQTGYEIRGNITEASSSKGTAYGAIDQGDAIKVRGKFYRKSPRVEITTSMNDPERWFQDALINQLAKGSVSIDADAKLVSLGTIYEHRSGLGPALRRMLEDSSNFDAEQLLRVLGAATKQDGSLQGGCIALGEQIAKLVGVLPNGCELIDGSGLSKENRLTPGLLVVAMFRSIGGPNGEPLREALPIAGRTGTLSDRFGGTDLVGRVRAKTGWIRGVSSLSGLIELPDGGVRWFSILMNYDRDRNGLNKELKDLQETMCSAIAAIGAN